MTQLTIELDHQKVYTTGDIVSGKVHLKVDEKIDLSSIDVTLWGISKSRNNVKTGQGYVTKLEKHVLLKVSAIVFPPPDILAVSTTQSYTLTEGSYTYNFAFTFPGKDHTPHCKEEKLFFHSHGYTKKEPIDNASLAPTYFLRKAFDDYCRIQYFVEAKVVNPSFFKFNTKEQSELIFYPSNADMSFSVNHIMDKKQILQDHDLCSKELKYSADGRMKVEGFFERLFQSERTQLPMNFLVEFKGALQTHAGPTKRLVRADTSVGNYIQISLQTPIRGFSSFSKSDEGSGNFKIRISSIKIKLILKVRYFAVRTTRKTHKYLLLDKPLDNEISLSDFEPASGNDAKGLYKFDLDPSWYECNVPDHGQSFVTCNVKRNFELHVSLGIASPEDINSEVIFKALCPIILQKREDILDTDRPPGYGNPPPEYGDEKNSEPMEWGI